ncbi:anti-sigma factor family protein [Candidatus Poribacteria bacterium]
MVCRKYRRLFSAYLDGDLDTEQCRRFEGHLAECDHCAAEFAEFREVVALTTSLPPIQPSPDFDTSLQMKLTDSVDTSGARPLFSRRVVFAFGAVCLLLVAFLSVYIIYDNDGPGPVQQVDEAAQFLVGREVAPGIPSRTDENTFMNFVMPSITATGELEGVDVGQEASNFILPVIMGKQRERDGPERNYVIRRISLIGLSDEAGL